MKVLVLTLLAIIAVTFANPVEVDSADESQLTLVDLDNDQPSDENAPEVARSKRFILKKIALAKAGALGIGALGLAGAAVAAKTAIGGTLFGGANQLSQGYGPSYGYNSYGSNSYGSNSYGSNSYGSNSYGSIPTTAYPSATYYTSQTYVPQQTYAPPQPSYVQPQPVYGPPRPSFNNPINGVLAWKAGLASNIGNAIGFNSQNQIQAAPSYAYGAPPVPSGPVPNKPLYVVCDN